MNNTVVRCFIFNGGGSTFSNDFVIVIDSGSPSSPLPGTGSGSSSTDVIIIAVVAGGGGLLALFCLLFAIAAIIWGYKRGRSPYRKLKQPDYAEIAYGDVKDDVVIPKKLADVRL